jgi:hypothetical protein
LPRPSFFHFKMRRLIAAYAFDADACADAEASAFEREVS